MKALIKISRDSNDFINRTLKHQLKIGSNNRHDTVWTGIKRHIH